MLDTETLIPTRCPSTNVTLIRDIGTLWAEFAVLVPAAHSFEDACHAKYFGQQRSHKPNSARAEDSGIRVMDTIYARAEDRSWMAEFLVIAVPDGLDEVHTRVVRHQTFDAEGVPEGYEIKWTGSATGWAIASGDVVIEKGFMTAESANLRLKALLAQQEVMSSVARKTTRPKKAAASA